MRSGSSGDSVFHLFLVHSHITHIVARAVVGQQRLNPERVAFLYARGFNPGPATPAETPIQSRRFDFELVPTSRKQRPSIAQGWQTLARIDALLRELTGKRRFHLYTPQTMEHIAQVLKNSRACSGFSFIEEGLYSYCSRAGMARTHPPRTPRRWERFAYRNRIRRSQFFDPGNEHAYGVSDAVFPDLDGRVVLSGLFPTASAAQTEGIGHVLVFDSLSVYRRIAVDTLLSALQRLFERLRQQQVPLLHYKLHPAQLGSPEQALIEIALQHSGLPVRRLDDSLSLEGLAQARPQTRFYVNLSSVGLYAALFGAEVYSYANWVAVLEPDFQHYIDLTPSVFSSHISML